MQTQKVEQLISQLSKSERLTEYKKYWDELTPKTPDEIENRWIFAHLSVHTSWSMNVSSYLLLKQHKAVWRNNREELMRLLKQSRVGLYKIREKGIWELVNKPKAAKLESESWSEYRDKIMCDSYGLGFAKTAFALEMCFPLACKAVCLDTHMLQLYGYEVADVAKVNSGKKYLEMERHWADTCDKYGIEPYIARCLFWDDKQSKTSSGYWSDVLKG